MSIANALLLAGALLAALLPATVYAQGQGQGQGRGGPPGLERPAQAQPGPPGRRGGGSADSAALSFSLSFSAGERRLIHDWFAHNPLQPAALPPGIARNLARGKPLPPGIAKRFLPQPLLAQLPARDGYDYLLIGASVVLVAAGTQIVVDVLADVL